MADAAGLDRNQIRVDAVDQIAARIPVITASAGRVRCSSNTPIKARVPGPSPSRRRAVSQNRGSPVNTPAARAAAGAVDPASAPGLRHQHFQVMVQDQILAVFMQRPGMLSDDGSAVIDDDHGGAQPHLESAAGVAGRYW